MHHPAVANRCKQRGERKVAAKDFGAQITIRHGNRIARPESKGLKCAAVLLQRDLALGPSVEVVEDRGRQSTLGEATQIFNIDDARRRDGSGVASHLSPRPTERRDLSANRVSWFGIAAGIVLHDVRARRGAKRILV